MHGRVTVLGFHEEKCKSYGSWIFLDKKCMEALVLDFHWEKCIEELWFLDVSWKRNAWTGFLIDFHEVKCLEELRF